MSIIPPIDTYACTESWVNYVQLYNFLQVQPYTECSMGIEPQEFSETKLAPQKFVEKVTKYARTNERNGQKIICSYLFSYHSLYAVGKNVYARKKSVNIEVGKQSVVFKYLYFILASFRIIYVSRVN